MHSLCSIHTTWGPSFSRAMYSQSDRNKCWKSARRLTSHGIGLKSEIRFRGERPGFPPADGTDATDGRGRLKCRLTPLSLPAPRAYTIHCCYECGNLLSPSMTARYELGLGFNPFDNQTCDLSECLSLHHQGETGVEPSFTFTDGQSWADIVRQAARPRCGVPPISIAIA